MVNEQREQQQLRLSPTTSLHSMSNFPRVEQEPLQGNNINNAEELNDDLEWEEWDGSSPFLHHCIAGGFAGIAEHTLLYPVDTVKTHMQSYCAECPNKLSGSSAARSAPSGFAQCGVKLSSSVKPAAMSSQVATAAARSPSSLSRVVNLGMWRTMNNIIQNGGQQAATASGGGGGSCVSAITAAVSPLSSSTALTSNTISSTAAPSFLRLWRGVQTMFVGCAPAHALYFSSYELIKSLSLRYEHSISADPSLPLPSHPSAYGCAAAGAVATISHDMIMTPLDTIKQRMQLGYYNGLSSAVRSIIHTEGIRSLYRSFPTTLMTNVPYGMVMVSTNEMLKEHLNPGGGFDIKTSLLSGCGAGMVAAGSTAPLDMVKTRLQTQHMGSVFLDSTNCSKAAAEAAAKSRPASDPTKLPRYNGMVHAFRLIVKEEGVAVLFRGVTPRVLTHMPAVAISWTTYECAKNYLLKFV